MRSIWFGALDAESSWTNARSARISLTGLATGNATSMEGALFALADPGDAVITSEATSAEHAEHLARALPYEIELSACGSGGLAQALRSRGPGERLRPWAIDQHVVDAWPADLGDQAPPQLEVVRRVNSKLWSAKFREATGSAAAVAVNGTEQLGLVAKSLLAAGRPIVVKEPLGVSGRGSLLIEGIARLERLLARLRKAEGDGLEVALVVEALIDKASDFSTHLEVTTQGRCQWIGACALDNLGFAYAGSRDLTPHEEKCLAKASHRPTITRIAEALAAEGYHGPVCIDGIVAKDGSLHSVIEVNARCSLGLAWLRLRRHYAERGMSMALSVLRCRPAPARSFGSLLGELAVRGQLARERGGAGAILLSGAGADRLLVALVASGPSELPSRRAALASELERAGWART